MLFSTIHGLLSFRPSLYLVYSSVIFVSREGENACGQWVCWVLREEMWGVKEGKWNGLFCLMKKRVLLSCVVIVADVFILPSNSILCAIYFFLIISFFLDYRHRFLVKFVLGFLFWIWEDIVVLVFNVQVIPIYGRKEMSSGGGGLTPPLSSKIDMSRWLPDVTKEMHCLMSPTSCFLNIY